MEQENFISAATIATEAISTSENNEVKDLKLEEIKTMPHPEFYY